MPSLAELTDQYPQQDTSLPVAQPYRGANLGPLSAVGVPTGVVGGDPTVAAPVPAIQPNPNSVGTSGSGSQIIDKLLGLGGQERYQLWPEKVIRDAISAPHDIIQVNPYPEGSEEASWFEDQRQSSMVPAALNMSALAGTGGLAGVPMDSVSRLGTNLRILGKKIGTQVGEDAVAPESEGIRSAYIKSGDKIFEASNHPLAIENAAKAKGIDLNDNEAFEKFLDNDISSQGFVTSKGRLIDRNEAYDIAKDNKQIQNSYETKSLDASDPSNPIKFSNSNVVLGSGPFLRPALKVGDKIYKAPIKDAENPLGFGAEHSDALPAHLADDFYKKAMSGEDINHYNFGFVNHKGQFLDRGKALDYGIEQGLVDPQNGKYGVLTSTMLADSSKPGTAIEAMAKTQPFYSALEHNVNATSQAKMTGDQWLGTLANKPGVKPEELDWTGVKSFLQEKGNQPVTKAELQEHLQNNKVELKEVDKGVNQDEGKKEIIASTGARLPLSELDNPIAKRTLEKIGYRIGDVEPSIDPTKYHSYQLPGGENYREKLLTLPPKSKTSSWKIRDNPDAEGEFEVVDDKGKVRYGTTEKEDAQKYINDQNEIDARSDAYKSSHWDEPNILAHVRMNDRMIDGKKSLHLEEIQSDWHQQGRDIGYKTGAKDKFENFKNDLFKKYDTQSGPELRSKASKEDLAKFDELYKQHQAENAKNSQVPNAPFKKSWHELALKRMIREAAEKGYSRLSWTPGEAQAARYDLSKQIDKVQYHSDTQRLVAFDKNHNLKMDENIPPEKVSDYVGKEAAKKLLEVKPNHLGIHTLENADLKIGGEGMKGFYDQIIPKALEKISGEKVKSGTLPLSPAGKSYESILKDLGYTKDEWNAMTKEQRAAAMDKSKVGQPIHYIDIPQSLKDKALGKGFPLFSSTHIFTPVSHNPFEDKKK